MNQTRTRRGTGLLAGAAIVALGLGLWLAARDGAGGAERASERDGETADAEPGSAEIAALEGDGDRRTSVPTGPGIAQSWRVVVRADDAVAASGARIRASQQFGDARLTADGEARWDDIQPGRWTLEVEADGYPLWSRAVVIDPGESKVTVAMMGEPYRIVGTVRDVERSPCAEHFVGFLPVADAIPSEPLEWLSLPSTRTDGEGRFAAEIKEAGDYRMFIGHRGRIRLLDDEVLSATSGAVATANVVVPVPTRLAISGRDEGGPDRALQEGTLYAFSIYRRAEILDLERPLPEVPEPEPVDLNAPGVDDEMRAELEASLAKDGLPVPEDDLRRRRSVVPEGWRVDRSSGLAPGREIVLTDLPASEELRFAARRGVEVFRVEGSVAVHPNAVTRVRLVWPEGAMDPESTDARVVQLLSSIDPAGERLTAGVEWELER